MIPPLAQNSMTRSHRLGNVPQAAELSSHTTRVSVDTVSPAKSSAVPERGTSLLAGSVWGHTDGN